MTDQILPEVSKIVSLFGTPFKPLETPEPSLDHAEARKLAVQNALKTVADEPDVIRVLVIAEKVNSNLFFAASPSTLPELFFLLEMTKGNLMPTWHTLPTDENDQ